MSPGRPGDGPSAPAQRPTPQLTAQVQEVLDAVEAAEPVGIPSLLGLARGVALAVGRPGPASREAARVVADLAQILRGTDRHRPAPRDKRFADPAWSLNPGYRRLAQGYLALGDALHRLVEEYGETGADWHDVERARFAVDALTSALAPTNTLPGQPCCAQARLRHRLARALVRGAAQLPVRRPAQRRHAVADRPQRVRRSARTSPSRRRGHLPGRGRRADRVPRRARRPSGPADAGHPAADRPLLLPRPAPRPQLRGVRRQPRAAGVPHQLAQPHPRSRPTGTSTPTPRRIVRAIDSRQGGRPARRTSTPSGSAPAASCCRRSSATWPRMGDDSVPLRVVRRHAARLRQPGRRSAPSRRPGCWSSPRRQLAPQGRHHRAVAGRGLQLDAPGRPRLQLRRQQLADGRGPAGLRHPRLERRRDEPAGAAARSSSSTSSATTH